MFRNLPYWRKGQCLIYGRVSKESQDAGLADQYTTIQAVMRQANLNPVVEPFEDDGKRGHDEGRPGLLAVMNFVRTHPNKVRKNEEFIPILVFNVARFGRFDNPKKLFRYIAEIEEFGYEFYSIEEGIRSRGNLADFVNLIVRGEQAYQFTLDLSVYGIRTGTSLADKGWWSGGMAPFGYDRMTYGPDGKPRYRYVTRVDKAVEKYDPKGELVDVFPPIVDNGKVRSAYSDKLKNEKVRLIPNPQEAKIVRLMFDWLVSQDCGLGKIASKLNAMGVPSVKGRKWFKNTVRAVLMNVAHKGTIAYGRRSDGKHHDVSFVKEGDKFVPKVERRDVAAREFVHRALKDCVIVENCHEAIISPELWEKAQVRLTRRKQMKGVVRGQGARGSVHILSGDGLLKCVHCGYHFHGMKDRTSGKRYYIDGGYQNGGREVCDLTLVGADALERHVVQAIRSMAFKLFDGDDELEREVERMLALDGPSTPVLDPRVEALQEKLSVLTKKRQDTERLAKEYGPETVAVLLERMRLEEVALNRELLILRNASPAVVTVRDRRRMAQEAVGYHRDFVRAFQAGTPDEKRRFIRDFVGSIEVDGRTRKIKIGYFADVGNSPLTVIPRTGFEPVSSA
jgi:hypothetical protein